jgi:phospholipid/cholesterol/gamma-HCH transport system substrate-binding protein
MERDARYAAVALFVLAAIAAAFAFVWWYSGKGDRRVYERYEIYFEGSVSGLAQGSPVRYLGVDVGRVENLSVDRDDPGRVKVVTEVDSDTPLSGATRARLGLLGLTGLLYIDLQLDPEADADERLLEGERYRVIQSRKGDIEAFVEKLPDLVAQTASVVARVETLLGDENLQAVGDSLLSLREASANLPTLSRDAASLASDLRGTAVELGTLARSLQSIAADSRQDIEVSLENAGVAAEKLAHTAASLDRIVTSNEAVLTSFAGSGLTELQQLLVDVRDASAEVRALARSLREQPSSLLKEPKESGVEIAP